MLRSVTLALLCAVAPLARASVWPTQVGPATLKSERSAAVTADRALWDELGLMSATEGDYGAFQATAYRFKDPTDAFAAEQWLAGAGAGAILAGNYVIICQGTCPAAQDLKKIELPRQRRDEQPLAWAYLPSQGMVAHSGRYALGPVGLRQFAPRIPAAAAGFQFGTEVATAKYRTPKGEEQLVLLYFPIPQMARQQLPQFRRMGGAVVKRSGSLIAVVLGANAVNPPDVEAANRLVGEINYRASVSYDEQPPVPVRPETIGRMILSIFELAGLLIVFCILAGFGFAGIQMLRKHLGPENADGTMITLHLVDR